MDLLKTSQMLESMFDDLSLDNMEETKIPQSSAKIQVNNNTSFVLTSSLLAST